MALEGFFRLDTFKISHTLAGFTKLLSLALKKELLSFIFIFKNAFQIKGSIIIESHPSKSGAPLG
jgi:hypothetical protein